MTTLTIDIGNNKSKYDLWTDKGHLERIEPKSNSVKEVKEVVEKHGVKGVIVSSVKKDIDSFVDPLREVLDTTLAFPVVEFNVRELKKYSHRIKYSGNIGTDRIAAFLGVEETLKNEAVLIADLGTAITLDVTDKNGDFVGGNISLGLFTRLKVLADSTSMLPLVDNVEKGEWFGHDTLSAIATGALNGVIAEVVYTIKKAKEEFKIKKVVFTGGDAPFVVPLLNLSENSYRLDPYLVGRGLNAHLRQMMAEKV